MSLHHWMSLLVGLGMLAMPVRGEDQPVSGPFTSFEQLSCMSWHDLDKLYRQLQPGKIPNGFAQGKAIYPPCERLSRYRSRVTDQVWLGKHFCAANATLINQWVGMRAIRAHIYEGPSWLDGRPALILDYRDSSRVWSTARDEMREVSPGIYLGTMFMERCPQPYQKVFFVLQMQNCGGPM